MEGKLRVALLFGGRSAEHDVSLRSAANVFRALDPARYEVVLIAVARSGSRGCSQPRFLPTARYSRFCLAVAAASLWRLMTRPSSRRRLSM